MTYLEKLKAERKTREEHEAFLSKRNEVVVTLSTLQNDLSVTQWNEIRDVLNRDINIDPLFYASRESA